mmetsp:Transcript_58043/g.172648  ORF Transcript_58043/g.172648 Transcript_58043/m.172648 type:complete len:1043 (+) Transcript_58043:671-3799(+)
MHPLSARSRLAKDGNQLSESAAGARMGACMCLSVCVSVCLSQTLVAARPAAVSSAGHVALSLVVELVHRLPRDLQLVELAGRLVRGPAPLVEVPLPLADALHAELVPRVLPHGVLDLGVVRVRGREHGVHVVGGLEPLPLAHVGVAEGDARLGDVAGVRVDGHAEAGPRHRRVELGLVGLPALAARADRVADARPPGRQPGLLDYGDAGPGDGGARAAHLRAQAAAALAALPGAAARGRRGPRAGVGARLHGGLGLLRALGKRGLAGLDALLRRTAKLCATLVVDRPDGPRHALEERAALDLEVPRELADVDGPLVAGVQVREEGVQVCGRRGDPVLLARALEVGERDEAVVVAVQAPEDLGGLDLASVGRLERRDCVSERLHHVPRLPVVLVARGLLVGRALPGRAVPPQLAVEAVVHGLDGPPLVRRPVDAGDEGLHVHLVVPVGPLRGDVGLDVGVHQLQARGHVAGRRRANLGLHSVHPRGGGAALGAWRVQGQHVGLDLALAGVERLLRRQRPRAAGALELAHDQVHELVLVHHAPVLQELLEPGLGDPLRQRLLRARGLGADVLYEVLGELRSVTRPVGHPALPVAELVRDDAHVVFRVLLRPVQVHVHEASASERHRPLEEVVLALPALHAAGRRGAVVVGEVRQLAHEAAPVDALALDLLLLLARELGRPEELDGLGRDVAAGGAQGARELPLVHAVVPLGVHVAEGISELATVLQEAVDERLGDVPDMALPGLVRLATDVHAGPVDEVAELLEGHGALAVLVHRPDEQLALLLADPDAHLVEDLRQVLREHEPGLRQGAVPEHVDQPGPARVALPDDGPQPLHPHHGVAVLGGRVEEVGQVHRPDLEVVARLLAGGVDEAPPGVVLLAVEVQGVVRARHVRPGRGHVGLAPHGAHEPVLGLGLPGQPLRGGVVPRLALLLLQGTPLVGGVLVPPGGVPARSRLVALLPAVPVGLVHAGAVLPERRHDGHGRLVQARRGGLAPGLRLALLPHRPLGVGPEVQAGALWGEVRVPGAGDRDGDVRVRLVLHLPGQG